MKTHSLPTISFPHPGGDEHHVEQPVRTCHLFALLALTGLLCLSQPAVAALVIPSDGTDGDLIVSNDLVIDLSTATSGNWDADNTGNMGRGVYDPAKWAVVFKYSSVTVSNGATLTFLNHPSRAPVVWLVVGDIVINGTVSLNGNSSLPPPALPEPGPGGFRGGAAYFTPGVEGSAGFGPGGGSRTTVGYGGSYGSQGSGGPAPYGNPSLLPLIGGSGGGGDGNNTVGGGAGAGAMLMACSGTLTVDGEIRANGGNGVDDFSSADSGGGSGGGIRLVAASLDGSGILKALGGGGRYPGGLGRIRVERVQNSSSLQITPEPSVVTLQEGSSPLIWLPAEGPTARIVSIGSVAAPDDPRASFGASGPDVAIPESSTTPVLVETTNVEPEALVIVRVTPRSSSDFSETVATGPQVLSQDPLVIRWTADVPVSPGYSAVQVRVRRP